MREEIEPGHVHLAPEVATQLNLLLGWALEQSAGGRNRVIRAAVSIIVGSLSSTGFARETSSEGASNLGSGLITAERAASRIGVSRQRVRALCRGHRFPGAVQLGDNGPWLIPENEVDDYRFGVHRG